MKLNQKGYMLVEIILSSVLAMTIAYYLLNLTYQFKNIDEDIYQSITYENDKIAITKNIMNDVESGKVISINDSRVIDNKKIMDFSIKLDSKLENRRITIEKKLDGTVIYYGKYNGADYDKEDISYYEKKIQSSLIVGDIVLEKERYYLNLVIPIRTLYTDDTYDIKIFIQSDPAPILKTVSSSSYNGEFWAYKDEVTEIVFQNEKKVISEAIESWDVSSLNNETVIAYLVPNAFNSTKYTVYIQGSGGIIANTDSSYLFANFQYLYNIRGLEYLDTTNVTNMKCMFYRTGYDSAVFRLDLGDKFTTSQVVNMDSMFNGTGHNSGSFTLNLGDNFDTSNVTDMKDMFNGTGSNSMFFTLDLGDKFDTSNVKDMSNMFAEAGYFSSWFTLDLGHSFDTSQVVNMKHMFDCTGHSSVTLTLDLGDKFDTSNVTDMSFMFQGTGNNYQDFKLNLSTFDFSRVTKYEGMFLSWKPTQKVYVKNHASGNWLIDNTSLIHANVVIR